jgi:hypothetical protein
MNSVYEIEIRITFNDGDIKTVSAGVYFNEATARSIMKAKMTELTEAASESDTLGLICIDSVGARIVEQSIQDLSGSGLVVAPGLSSAAAN